MIIVFFFFLCWVVVGIVKNVLCYWQSNSWGLVGCFLDTLVQEMFKEFFFISQKKPDFLIKYCLKRKSGSVPSDEVFDASLWYLTVLNIWCYIRVGKKKSIEIRYPALGKDEDFFFKRRDLHTHSLKMMSSVFCLPSRRSMCSVR